MSISGFRLCRLVSIGAATVALSLAGQFSPAANAEDPRSASTVADLGPAVVGTAVNGAELVGDKLYLVSRQAVPANLATLDLSSRTVVDVTDIPSGIEGWAATAVNGGRDLYFGMHTPADLYHYDTVSATLDTQPVATFPRELLVMDQTAAPDDVIYVAGMARGASGGVYAFNPATRAVEALGTPAPGQRYVRSIAADENRVYAGMGPAASIRYRDRNGGDWATIDVPELTGESFVYDIAVAGRYLTFGTEPSGLFGMVDLETNHVTVVPVPGGRTVDSIVMDGTMAYFTVRPDGVLYSYDIVTGTLTELATPSPGAEHRKLFVSKGDIIGVGGAGDVWRYSLADGSVDLLDAIESGMPRSPERAAQSLTVMEGYAYVGGHWGIQRHDDTTGSSTRFAIPGETKTMVGVRGTLFASIYPSSQVWTHDPDTGSTQLLAQIRDNQMRPRTSHYNKATDSLLVGTREVYGNVGGAISVVDPDTGDISTHRDLVTDQTPVSLTSINSTAFVGHEIHGEVHDPTTTEAHLVGWDIASASTTWDVVPVPDSPAITGLAAYGTPDGPAVYGLTSNGWLFAVDPQSGEVIERIKTGSRASDLVEAGGAVHALIDGSIFRIVDHAPGVELELVDPGAFTHLAVDDTDDFRLYAVGIRSVDGVSQARLFVVEMGPTHPVIRWSVSSSDGEELQGSTFRVKRPGTSTEEVMDNGPLDRDPDDGQFLIVGEDFGRYFVRQLRAAPGYLVDRRTRHVVATATRPSPESMVFVNRPHPRH